MTKIFQCRYRLLFLLILSVTLALFCVACSDGEKQESSEKVYATAEPYGGDVSFAFPSEEAIEGVRSRQEITVVIDAGHGDRDPGVLATLGDLEVQEADVNLALGESLSPERFISLRILPLQCWMGISRYLATLLQSLIASISLSSILSGYV